MWLCVFLYFDIYSLSMFISVYLQAYFTHVPTYGCLSSHVLQNLERL